MGTILIAFAVTILSAIVLTDIGLDEEELDWVLNYAGALYAIALLEIIILLFTF